MSLGVFTRNVNRNVPGIRNFPCQHALPFPTGIIVVFVAPVRLSVHAENQYSGRNTPETGENPGAGRYFSTESGCLTNFQHSPARVAPSGSVRDQSPASRPATSGSRPPHAHHASCLVVFSLLAASPARADLHITSDHGGYVEEYKTKYARIRDRHERVIIDGVCNSACTLVFGIVPMNKICVTPRASLGFHGLLRQGVHLRHQGDEHRRDLGPDVLLSGYGEGLDPPQWRADHRDEEDQERR